MSKPIAPSKSSNSLAAGQRQPRSAQRRREVNEVSKRYHQLVALRKRDGTFDTTPSPDEMIEAGDVLIGVGTPEEIRKLEDFFAPREALAR